MAIREKFELVIDVITGQSTTGGLGKLRSDLGETEGAFGKLKVAGSSAMSFVSDHIASFAIAGAGALAAFAVSAVTEFQGVALGAGQLRDSLGITADEASRLQEVAGDLGIGVGALESSIGFMNKTLGKTPELFASLGVEIARNRDGTTDVIGTYENVADRLAAIKDPAERATTATQLLGRGWKESAELIIQGGEGVERAMQGVSSQQVVSDKQIQQARDLRDNLDDLGDKVDQAKISLGSQLVPAVNDTLDAFSGLADAIAPVIGLIEELGNSSNPVESALGGAARRIVEPWRNVTDALDAAKVIIGGTSDEITGKLDPAVTAAGNAAGAAAGEFDDLNDATNDAAAGQGKTAAAADRLKESQEGAAAAAKQHVDDLDRLADALNENGDAFEDAADAQIDMTDAQKNAIDVSKDQNASIEDVRDASIDAADKTRDFATAQALAAGKVLTSTEKLDNLNGALIDQASQLNGPQRQAVLDYIGNLNGIPAEKRSEIQAAINDGDLDTAKRLLAEASAPRTSYIKAEALTAAAAYALDQLSQPRTVTIRANQVVSGARAGGGPVVGGRTYLVGEEGPELFTPPGGGNIVPNDELTSNGGTLLDTATGTTSGVTNITVNVTAPFGTNPDAFARAVGDGMARCIRQNGPGR